MRDWLAEARQVHADAVVLDMHADTPQRFVDEGWTFSDEDLRGGHISLSTARSGGLDGEFLAAWVEPHEWAGRYAERTRALIDGVHAEVAADAMRLCLTADDVLRARAAGQFAALIGIEGGHSIEGSLELLEDFYGRGVRYMTLTWSNSNEWADSSGDVARHGGLTELGKEVVRAMNRLGMVVDVSHVSDATFWDVLKVADQPVIASHSSARALTAAPRNLTDEMMRAVADSGGVVGINFFPAFIDEGWRAAWNALKPERVRRHEEVARPFREHGEAVPFHVSDAVDREFTAKIGRAPFRSLIDHFLYAMEVVGPQHVGIGTDFDGIPEPPEGIDSAADLPKVTAALLEAGIGPEEMKNVLGENLLRVMRAVER
jgi:membrane dipeptidase